MTDSEKKFVVHKYLTETLVLCRKDMGLCVRLVAVLNEISSSDEMVALVSTIETSNSRTSIDISAVINESAETLDKLYAFIELL